MNKMNTKRNKNKCPSSNTNDKSVGSSSSKCILSEKVPDKLELKNGLVKIPNDVSKEKMHNRKSKRNKLKPNINGETLDQKKGLGSINSLQKVSEEPLDESKKIETTCPLHNIVYQSTDEKKKNETDCPNGGIEYTCLCEQCPESIKIDNSPLYLMFLPQKAQDGAISCCSSETTEEHPVYNDFSKVDTLLEDHTTCSNEQSLQCTEQSYKEIKQTVGIPDGVFGSSSLSVESSTKISNCQAQSQDNYCISYGSLLISGSNTKKAHENSVEETIVIPKFEKYGWQYSRSDRYPKILKNDFPNIEEEPKQEGDILESCTKESAGSKHADVPASRGSTVVKDNVRSLNTETNLEDLSESVSNVRLDSDDKESSGLETLPEAKPKIEFVQYESELQMPMIMKIIQKDLSEPYSIYTYRYFIHNWPKLCFLAMCDDECVGAIVCKLDVHRKVIKRGYIAMLAVDQRYRKLRIGSNLVQMAINEMLLGDADEVVLETEVTNKPALQLYEKLGFVRDKRLFRYYLNGVDALRLKLWLR